MFVEICVDNLASVQAAARAGADRIELCAGLVEGGTTPSIGFLNAARREFPGKIMVMLRPRGGDFVYSEDEFELMLAEIAFLRREGADGVVFGLLHPDGTIDAVRTKMLMVKAGALDMTFHRAFDVTRSPTEALETLISLGIPRVLTSGGEPDVNQGIEAIAGLVRQAAGRITILPGGGLEANDVGQLVRQTGVSEVHLAALVTEESPMLHRRHDIPMGAAAVPGEYERRQASETDIRFAKESLMAFTPPPLKRGMMAAVGKMARAVFRRK